LLRIFLLNHFHSLGGESVYYLSETEKSFLIWCNNDMEMVRGGHVQWIWRYVHLNLHQGEVKMKRKHGLGVLLLVAFFALSGAAWGDDRPADWPSNWGKWGPDDEIGTLNYVTPQVLVEAAKLVKQGKIIPVSLEAEFGKYPLWGHRVGIERFMNYSGKDWQPEAAAGKGGFGYGAYTDEVIKTGSHSMTHMDPLAHVWWGDQTYNGYKASDIVQHTAGLLKANANAYIPHSATRGVLLDVAKYKGVDVLEGGYVITPEDLDGTAKMENVEIKPGDAILIRTGFMKKWVEIVSKEGRRWNAFKDGEAGPSCSAIKWIIDHKIALIGADNIGVEAIPAEKGCNEKYKMPVVPLHIGTLSMLGNPMQELLDLEALAEDSAKDGVYEFLYVWTPLNFKNAAGGLMSPIAIK
jgi:kynurenine formamidase